MPYLNKNNSPDLYATVTVRSKKCFKHQYHLLKIRVVSAGKFWALFCNAKSDYIKQLAFLNSGAQQ